MTTALADRIEAEATLPPPPEVTALVERLADPTLDAAWLYYGSTLRTGDLTGVLDFYRLTRTPHRRGLQGLVERLLWPEVSFHEVEAGGRILRAKVATLPLAVFRKAAEGRTLDTTIWARFCQPVQRVWAADPGAAADATLACAAAVTTAARFAAVLGPSQGLPEAFWLALFRRTYATEFRMETTDRAASLLGADAGRYASLLTLAWTAGGVGFREVGTEVSPTRAGLPGWRLPSLAGKPLNLARIAKAAFTFDGAARYAAWKVARHTGIELEVTPFRERHPFLAAPGAWWELRRRQAVARRERLSSPKS